MCDLIFDTICTVDELGKPEDAAGHFEAADSAEDASEETDAGENGAAGGEDDADKTVSYQLILNKGLKFSDGTGITVIARIVPVSTADSKVTVQV